MAWTDWFRRTAPTAPPKRRLPRDAGLQLGERLAVHFRSGNLRLLPYLDTLTEETAEHRAAYRKAHAEPAIKAALLSKLFAVGSLDLQMEPASERPRDVAIAEFTKDCLERAKGGVAGLVLDIAMGGTLEGNSLGEKVWVPDDRRKWQDKLGRRTVRLQRLHPHDPEDYDLMVDEQNQVKAIRSTREFGEEYGLAKFVHYVHLPLYGNPLGTSDIRANYREFWIIDTATKFHAIGLERFVLPYWLVQHDDEDILRLLGNAVKYAKSLGYIQAPKEAVVQAIQMAWNSSIFENAIRLYTQRIFLGITGAFLQAVEGAATGSRSIGEVHQTSSELVIWYLANTIAEVINDQIIPDIVRWNFLDADPPRCSLSGVSADEQAKMLDLYLKAQQAGLELSKKELRKKIGFQAPLDEADTLKPAAAAAAGGMGALPFAETPPQVAQTTDYTCGPAALMAALEHFGVKGHTEASLSKACGTDPANGTSPEMLATVAKAAGLTADLQTSLTLADLREATEAGRLVICAIQDGPAAEEAALEAGHYVVVYGANSSAITYEDPAGGSLEVVYPEEFLESWVDTGPRGVVYRRLGIVLDKPAEAAWGTATDDPAFAAAEADAEPGTSPTPKPQPSSAPASDEFALVGPDGRKVAQLLATAKQQGVRVLSELCEQAVRRFARGQRAGSFFTEAERAELEESLAAGIASADLLGRARVRLMQQQAERSAGRVNFSETGTNFKAFDEQPIRPLPPQKALDYFSRLVPKLGKNPGFDDQMRRTAFTMAEATESTLLTKVQDLITQRLAEGLPVATPQAIDDLLVAAGVTPKNPQYAEMVMRTNMADAYNQGAGDELRHPDVIEAFPAWEYLAVARPGDKTQGDGRNRPHHLARNGNLYPSDLSFDAVRGDDIGEKVNCRCTFAPVTRHELAERLARGQKVQRFSESCQDRKNFCQEGPNAGKPGPCPDPSKQDSGSGQKKSKEQARKEHFQKQFPASARAPVVEKLAKLEAALGHATGAVAGGAKKVATKAVGLVVSNTRAWIGNANGIYKEELAKADPGTKAKMLAVAKGTARVYFATYEKNKERYGKGVAAIMQAVHTSLSFPVTWSLRVGTAGLVPGVGTVAHYAVGKAVEGTAALMHKGLLKAGVKKGLHLGFSEDDPLAYLNAVAADLEGLKPTDFKSFDLDAIVTDLKAQRAAAGLSEVTDEQILAALLPLLPEA